MQAEPKTPEPPDDVPMVAVADNQISFADWNDAQNWSAIEKMTYEPAMVELNKADTSNEPPLPPADGAPASEQKAAEHAERPAPPRERSNSKHNSKRRAADGRLCRRMSSRKSCLRARRNACKTRCCAKKNINRCRAAAWCKTCAATA